MVVVISVVNATIGTDVDPDYSVITVVVALAVDATIDTDVDINCDDKWGVFMVKIGEKPFIWV